MAEDLCDQLCVTDEADVAPLRAKLLDVAGLSELFKALADETRVRLLYLLLQRELCVCDLAVVLEMSMPAVSHHLRFLKTLRLVKSRKDKKLVFYSLADGHVPALIEQARVHYIERR